MRVRIIKMQGADIELFKFDWDLTWSALFMNAHGHVYARYGARKDDKAEGLMSLRGLARVMEKVLEAHKAGAETKPAKWTPRASESLRGLPDNLRTGRNCMHCHQVWEGLRREKPVTNAEATETYPLPENLGITLDVDLANVVKKVSGAAAKAGVKEGDELVAVNGTPVCSVADASYALHVAKEKEAVALEVMRDGRKQSIKVSPPDDWKRRDISWRGSMWQLRPHPGFGGPPLSADERSKLGVAWGFRINYIVDWGDDRATGVNAMKAGLKKGDIIVSAGGKSDFASELDFQAWFRLTQKGGTEIEFGILRDGKPQKIRMRILP